ncbi:MAG: menaquinone biosynthesis protein [Candidatus Eiseniibacteriota bacterium]
MTPEAGPARGTASADATALAVLARIPYLNAEPFYTRWSDAPGTTVDLPPRALGEEARAGRADAGLMAVADWFSLAPSFERVGPFGIACRGAVQSVLLFSRRPVDSLAGASVDLTTESSTSVALTRLLLGSRYALPNVRYERRAVEDGAAPEGDAWLLIGDAALRARADHAAPHVLDLGQAWLEWTGLPFVYAVWAVRSSLPGSEKERLAAFLETSLAEGESDLDAIAARYASARPGLGSAAWLADYLRAFRYRLSEDEERGLARFRALYEEHCVDA